MSPTKICNYTIYQLGWSQKHSTNKVTKGLFQQKQNQIIPQTFQSTILSIFQKGLEWLGWALSKRAHRISKTIFELSFY